jgi:hypothetical protein
MERESAPERMRDTGAVVYWREGGREEGGRREGGGREEGGRREEGSRREGARDSVCLYTLDEHTESQKETERERERDRQTDTPHLHGTFSAGA